MTTCFKVAIFFGLKNLSKVSINKKPVFFSEVVAIKNRKHYA